SKKNVTMGALNQLALHTLQCTMTIRVAKRACPCGERQLMAEFKSSKDCFEEAHEGGRHGRWCVFNAPKRRLASHRMCCPWPQGCFPCCLEFLLLAFGCRNGCRCSGQ